MENNPITHSKMTQLHIIRVLASFYREQFQPYKDYDVIICDRYMQSASIFINTLFRCGFITNFDRDVLTATLKDYEFLLPKADYTVYLKRDVKWCMEHIQIRSRMGEMELCNETYITALIGEYEKYMCTKDNVHIIEKTNLTEITQLLFLFISEKAGNSLKQ